MALSAASSSLRASLRLLNTARPCVYPRYALLYKPTSNSSSSLIATTASVSRSFATSPVHLKKRKISIPDEKPTSSNSQHASSKRVTGGKQKNLAERQQASENSPLDADAPDPLDFSALHEALAPVDAHFKGQMQTLLHGGRFNPETIGALGVAVKAEGEGEGETTTYPLRELAQVVPRGRTHISLLLNDAAYAKPIMSAIQSSPDFNQQPQKSEDNELELILRVEAERKDEVVKRAKEVAQQWRDRVRQARSKHEKTLKDWKKKRLVLPDDLRKAEKELQKVQDGKMKEIETEEANLVKQLQR